MIFRKLSVILVVFFYLAVSNVFAAAKEDFQTGLKAFKDKQYEQAIQSFEHARRQGMKGSALYYNLAVSHFRTGNYKQAKLYFNKTRLYKKLKYLSEYNLGLVALKQADKTIALAHFRNVSKKAKEKNLVKLANYQISQLTQKPAKRWDAFIQLAYGHDDNVTTVTDVASKQSTNFLETYVYGSTQLTGTANQGLSLNGYILDTRYDVARVLDLRVLGLGLEESFTLGKWQNSLAIEYTDTEYRGQDFQTSYIYEANTQYELSPESNFRLRYRYYDINSESPVFDYLAGTKQRLRLEYRQYPGQDKLRLYYEYETNDRSETLDTPSNYSPTRHTLRGAYTYALSDKLALKGDLAYRVSDYPAGSINPAREETRTKTNLELTYYLNKIWFLTAEYTYTDNDSDVAAYRYKRNVSAISVNASF